MLLVRWMLCSAHSRQCSPGSRRAVAFLACARSRQSLPNAQRTILVEHWLHRPPSSVQIVQLAAQKDHLMVEQRGILLIGSRGGWDVRTGSPEQRVASQSERSSFAGCAHEHAGASYQYVFRALDRFRPCRAGCLRHACARSCPQKTVLRHQSLVLPVLVELAAALL